MRKTKHNINTHHFTLILPNVNDKTEGLEDAIFEASCDDALIFFKNNITYLEFDREAETFEKAVLSAIQDIEKSPLGIKVTRVEPDMLVNLSDIAQRTKLSRQFISMLVSGKRGDGSFPAPVSKITSSQPIWNWNQAAKWMVQYKHLDKEIAQQASFIEDINGALNLRNKELIQRQQALLKKLESVA